MCCQWEDGIAKEQAPPIHLRKLNGLWPSCDVGDGLYACRGPEAVSTSSSLGRRGPSSTL